MVFFGRLEERKGLCTFLEALHVLPPTLRRTLHVLFLGKILPLYSASLAHMDSRQYIEREIPTDVSYSILSDLYSAEALHYVHEQRCPVVCLASPQENFPNTALEMGQLPVKLVVSDTGGFRETLELVKRSAGLYWFDPRTPRRSLTRSTEPSLTMGPPPSSPTLLISSVSTALCSSAR